MTQTALKLQLTDRQTADFEMIGNGGFAPLTGPQGSDDWKSVVENMTLTSGEYWPIPITLEQQAGLYGDELWSRDPDSCCVIRKVEPMRSALAAVDVWVSGIRRSDSQTRAKAPKFAWDKRFGLWKLNPLADWSEKQVWSYIHEHDVPYNPLHDQGYPSIGCTHCTRKPAAGEDARAGRWAGRDKTECGLHG